MRDPPGRLRPRERRASSDLEQGVAQMPIRRLIAALLMLALAASGPGSIPAADPPTPEQAGEIAPTRLGYLYGEVSFLRPGAPEWGGGQTNTPPAPGGGPYPRPGRNAEPPGRPPPLLRGRDRRPPGPGP